MPAPEARCMSCSHNIESAVGGTTGPDRAATEIRGQVQTEPHFRAGIEIGGDIASSET